MRSFTPYGYDCGVRLNLFVIIIHVFTEVSAASRSPFVGQQHNTTHASNTSSHYLFSTSMILADMNVTKDADQWESRPFQTPTDAGQDDRLRTLSTHGTDSSSVEMINNMNGTFANSYIRFQLALISGEEEEVEEERRKSRNKTLYQKLKNWNTELRNENENEKKDERRRKINNTSYLKKKMEPWAEEWK